MVAVVSALTVNNVPELIAVTVLPAATPIPDTPIPTTNFAVESICISLILLRNVVASPPPDAWSVSQVASVNNTSPTLGKPSGGDQLDVY